jgi:uncharacterized membrane protein YbhN (UPF0104 family)
MEDKTKRIWQLLLRIAVTTTLLGLVFSQINIAQLFQSIRVVRWQFVTIVWLLGLFAFWMRAIQLHFILRKQNCGVGITKIFGASSVTMLYSLIIPGMLSAGVKWYILKQHTGKGSNVLSSIIYNQMTDVIVKLLLGLMALTVANPSKKWQLPIICVTMMAAIIATSVLLLSIQTGAKLNTALKRVLKPFPKIIRLPAERILEQIKVFQTEGWSFHLQIIGINLAVSLIGVVIYICAAMAGGIAVPAMALVWQSSAVYILGRLPVSVANLGIREFTLIEFLGVYGIDPPAAILMSMIIFSVTILMAFIGAMYQITWAVSSKDRFCRKANKPDNNKPAV